MDSYILINFLEKNEFSVIMKDLITSSEKELKIGDQVLAKKNLKSVEQIAVICFIGKWFFFSFFNMGTG